jgi:hypothetical protein
MLALAAPEPAVAIGAITFVIAAFSVVAWLCRPRAEPTRPAGRNDVREHLVELTATGSVAEADLLAARLRRAGVVALANAGPVDGSVGSGFGARVVVLASDRERAKALLTGEQVAEGHVPAAEIEAELYDPARLEQLERELDERPVWWRHRLVHGERATMWAIRVGLCTVIAGWLAVLVSALV